MSKTLTEKYSSLSVQLDKVINEANSEITNMQNKLASKESPPAHLAHDVLSLADSAGMKLDHNDLQKKHDELTHAFKEKNRKLLQTQELYDKLKRKAMLGQMQNAAEDAVDSTLHATSAGFAGFMDSNQTHSPYQEQDTSYGQNQSHNTLGEQPRVTTSYQPSTMSQALGGSWFRTVGAQCKDCSTTTPSTSLTYDSRYSHHALDTSSTDR